MRTLDLIDLQLSNNPEIAATVNRNTNEWPEETEAMQAIMREKEGVEPKVDLEMNPPQNNAEKKRRPVKNKNRNPTRGSGNWY